MAIVNYAGIQVPVLVGKETTFGTAVSPTLPLGYMTSIRTSEKNNMERVHALGARNAQAIIPKKYEASGSVEGVYTTSRILAYVLGKVTTTDASPNAGQATHKIEEANALPYFTLEASMAGTGTADDVLRRYAGVVFQNIRLTAGLDQPLKFSSDFLAKTVSVTEKSTATAAAFDSNAVPPLAPQYASLEIDGTNAVGQIQNLEFTVENNLEYVWGLGNRLAQAPVPKVRTYDLKATINFNARTASETGDTVTEIYGRMLEGSGAASAFAPANAIAEVNDGQLIISNGLTTETTRNDLTFNLDGFVIESVDIDSPVEGVISLDFTAMYRGLDSTNAISAVDGILLASYGADF